MANAQALSTDLERRVSHILAIATHMLASGAVERRSIVLPIFIAGFATTVADAKLRAIDLIKGIERAGIGHNTSVTRQLLIAVCEEQGRRASSGGRLEEIDWLSVGRDRGLHVVNCGL